MAPSLQNVQDRKTATAILWKEIKGTNELSPDLVEFIDENGDSSYGSVAEKYIGKFLLDGVRVEGKDDHDWRTSCKILIEMKALTASFKSNGKGGKTRRVNLTKAQTRNKVRRFIICIYDPLFKDFTFLYYPNFPKRGKTWTLTRNMKTGKWGGRNHRQVPIIHTIKVPSQEN